MTDAQRKKSQRERTAKHRAKVKKESANDLAADEQRRRNEFDSWRVRSRLVSPGEREAFVDAETCPDALTVAREFLVALAQPDIQAGECLLDVERRVVTAWCAIGAPLLNRNTLRFDTETASAESYAFDFDKKWVALPGSDEPIDITMLPAAEVPAVEIVEDTAAKQLAIKVAAICKQQQDACDADARRISAKNLQRELEKEKRLGI
jgi:hypothetical protein